MVSREIGQRQAVTARAKARRMRAMVGGVTAGLIAVAVAIGVAMMVFPFGGSGSELGGAIEGEGCPALDGEVVASDECEFDGTASQITRVDFQPVVDSWVASVGGTKAVLIYDLDLDEVVGEYNADSVMRIESIYKIFVVYEGYRRVQSGEWDGEAACGYTGMTIVECLDRAIRESRSSAAEVLHSMIGYAELNNIMRTEFGLPGVTVDSISASAREVATMMRRFYEHPDLTDEALVARMMDSFLNQPASVGDGFCSGPCNWRRGLPSGFSEAVDVYNKVGWLGDGAGGWVYFADAALLDFKEAGRNYIAVVITSRVSNTAIAELGTAIETAFFAEY